MLFLNDLERTLGDVIRSGRVGAPVAFRILESVAPDESLNEAAERWTGLVRRLSEASGGGEPDPIAGRHDSAPPHEEQLSRLAVTRRGVTMVLALHRAPADRLVRLTLIGSGGVARLAWE